MKAFLFNCWTFALFCFFYLNVSSQQKNDIEYLLDSAKYLKYTNEFSSIDISRKVLKLAKDSGLVTKQIDALNLMAFNYANSLNDYDSAHFLVFEAYELSKKHNYQEGICDFYFMNGFFNHKNWNDSIARDYFQKSNALAMKEGSRERLADSYYYLSSVFLNEGTLDLAHVHIEKAIENYRFVNDKYGEAKGYFVKTLILLNENADSAIVNLDLSRDIYAELDDFLHVLACDYQKAIILTQQNKFHEARILLEHCLAGCGDNKKTEEFKFLLIQSLGEIYGKTGDFKKAYILQNDHKKYFDSIYSEKKFHEISNLQRKYEKKLEEKEKNKLKAENELTTSMLRKNRMILWLLIFILIQFIILTIIIYMKYVSNKKKSEELRMKQQIIFEKEKEIEIRKNEKMKQDLELKKRELVVKVFQIFQGNQMNKSILEKLKALKLEIKTRGRLGEKIRGTMQDMINDLKFNLNVQIWDEFEVYFNKVTPGFKKWLLNTYPDLTHNEIKLCIFSQLNLKTKEISNITLQSINSIDIAKKRLRKKLGINDQKINLASFLLCGFSEYKGS